MTFRGNTSNSSGFQGFLEQLEAQRELMASRVLRPKTDYMRELDAVKVDSDPQVVIDSWLISKERLRLQEQRRQKKERELETFRQEQRKKLAKLCYENWLRDKAQQAEQQRMEKHLQLAALRAADSSFCRDSADRKSRRTMPQAEIRQVVQSWWLKKQEQQQRQRRQLAKARAEQRRKELVHKSWQKWVNNVYDKPNRVPKNRGVDSWRGSV